MKKTFLNNLFKESTPINSFAIVIKRIKQGRYQLRDDSGRIFQADSLIHWSPGSRVSIQGDRIVGGGGSAPNIKTYVV